MTSRERRVLNALWRARYEDRENDGWVYKLDLWQYRKIEPNRLGFHMGPGGITVALASLESQELVESRWAPSDSPPRRREYRITKDGHGERAKHRPHARWSLLGKGRLRPETG